MIDLHNKLYTQIAELLADQSAQSAKQIYERLTNKGVTQSYQYIHKSLKVLEKNGLVSVSGGKYSLNRKYLKELRDFLMKASNTYSLDQNAFIESLTGSLLKLFSKEEADTITKNILKELNTKILTRLDHWYCDYYDLEGLEIKTILKEADFKGKRVLEVGCGTGRITSQLAKVAKEIVAIDRNKDAIEYNKEKLKKVKNVKFEVADFETLKNFKKEDFDIIVSGWIGLHHADELEPVVNTLHSLLKNKGKLLILEAYPDSEYVAILNKLKPKKTSIKEGQEKLRTALYKKFAHLNEKIVSPHYIFPTYEALEGKFKTELVYEEGYEWTEIDSQKLKGY